MGWVINATPRRLYPRERPGTNCVGGWVGLRAALDRCGKCHPSPEFDPRTVQPVASRCTDCAILTSAHGAVNSQNVFKAQNMTATCVSFCYFSAVSVPE